MSSEPDPIRVAVVGQLSSGKSALINALLGEQIAPMGVTPVTAVLHRFRWSKEREAVVENLDGTTSARSPESLIELPLTEQHLSQVRQVHIGLPSGALRDIEIWDTPGFGSNALAHELVARRALIDADIVLWVTPIDHALDKGEAEKLERLRHRDTPVLLVVNKADLADDAEERDEAVADIADDAGDLATAVVWVSALKALHAIGEGDSSKRGLFGFDRLEPKLAELASDALKARRDAQLRGGAAAVLGANEVQCPACEAVCRFDDKFCVCGRSLEDQHRTCPRCETDNTVHRPRCRGCNLLFEDWERAQALKTRAEQEIELGLLVDASATLTLAVEALPEDEGIRRRQGEVEEAHQKVQALVRAATRHDSGAKFCEDIGHAVGVLDGVGAGLDPFWSQVRPTALKWAAATNDRPEGALLVLNLLLESGAASQEALRMRESCLAEYREAQRLLVEALRAELVEAVVHASELGVEMDEGDESVVESNLDELEKSLARVRQKLESHQLQQERERQNRARAKQELSALDDLIASAELHGIDVPEFPVEDSPMDALSMIQEFRQEAGKAIKEAEAKEQQFQARTELYHLLEQAERSNLRYSGWKAHRVCLDESTSIKDIRYAIKCMKGVLHEHENREKNTPFLPAGSSGCLFWAGRTIVILVVGCGIFTTLLDHC